MTDLGLDLTDGDLEEYRLKCEEIITWHDMNSIENFDTEFVESVLEQIEEKNDLSDAQKAAIDKIISNFGIV